MHPTRRLSSPPTSATNSVRRWCDAQGIAHTATNDDAGEGWTKKPSDTKAVEFSARLWNVLETGSAQFQDWVWDNSWRWSDADTLFGKFKTWLARNYAGASLKDKNAIYNGLVSDVADLERGATMKQLGKSFDEGKEMIGTENIILNGLSSVPDKLATTITMFPNCRGARAGGSGALALCLSSRRNMCVLDIRIFAVSTSKTTTVTSNVAIDLSDDVEIHETHVKSEQASSLKSDLSSDPDLVSVLQGMFLPEVLEEILSAEDPVFLNRVLKNMQSDGLGSYSHIDQARYVSLKRYSNKACPCLILSNPTNNSHGEILGAFRSLSDLFMRIGGNQNEIPKVAELHTAGLAGIPIRNNKLVVRMFHLSDITTPEQVIADCENDPSKKTTLDELVELALTAGVEKGKKAFEANHEVQGHVKIICRAMYPDLPGYSQIFNLGTTAFAREYLKGKSRIFHVADASIFGANVAKGGGNGTAFPGVTVRQGECKGRYYHGFRAILVNKTTGEVLTEEEQARATTIRMKKKTKTK